MRDQGTSRDCVNRHAATCDRRIDPPACPEWCTGGLSDQEPTIRLPGLNGSNPIVNGDGRIGPSREAERPGQRDERSTVPSISP